MKKLIPKSLRFIPAALCLALALLAINVQAQTSYYFDVNDTTADSGVTSGGTFTWENTPGYWNTDSTGGGAGVISDWVDGGVPIFSAGTDANTYSYTVTANSDHTIAGMQSTSTGTVTINGTGTLTLADGTDIFGGKVTVNNVLAGSGTAILQSSALCNISLSGVNTFGGGVNLNGGSIYINNNSALGAGPISPILGGASPVFSALYGTGGSPLALANNFTIGTANAGIVFVTATGTPMTFNGNVDMSQTFYCRNGGPGTAPVTFDAGVMSGAGDLVLSANNNETIVLNGANTYTGKTIIGQGGGTRVYVNINSIQPVGSAIANSLGLPADATVGQIDIGTGAGAACALRYTGSGDSATDRIINNAQTSGGMWLFADGAGKITLSGNITAAINGTAARTLTIQGSSTALNTISGAIQDSTGTGGNNQVAVTKDGTGTWVLSGNNTFSGALTVQGGGTLYLGGAQTFPGNIAVGAASAGTLKLSAANAIPSGTGKGTLTVNSGSTFDLNGYNCTINPGTFAGTIDNTTGTATLTIGYPGSANATVAGLIRNTSPGVLNVTINGGASGDGIQLNGAANTYTGRTTVNNGILHVSADANLGTAPGSLVPDKIILDHNLGWSLATGANANNYYFRCYGASCVLSAYRGIYLGNSLGYGGGIGVQGSGNTATINGPISGPGSLWIGGGTSGAGVGTVLLNGACSYLGGTYIVGGTLKLGADNVLPANTPLTMGAGSTYFDLGGHSQTIGTLTITTGDTPQFRFSGSGTLTIIQGADTTFNGAMNQNSGSGGNLTLHASSTGKLTLSAAANYSGATTINGGTLALSSAGAIASSTTITVGRAGTFDVSAKTTALTLGASQILNAGGTSGSSAKIATASGKGLTLGASSPLNFTAVDGTTVPLSITGAGSLAIASGNPITVTTTTTLGAGSYRLVQIGSGNTTAVTGTPGALTVNGVGVSGTASLRIDGGELFLDVAAVAPIINSSSYDPATGHLTISGENTGGVTQNSRLVYTDDLSGTPVWQQFIPDMTSTGTTFSFTITDVTTPAHRFYKVQNY